jgi:hypothetical protein
MSDLPMFSSSSPQRRIPSNHGPLVQQHTEIDINWLDANGFMTQVPEFACLISNRLHHPKTNRLVGSYIRAIKQTDAHGHHPEGLPLSVDVLKFSISATQIHQELPGGRKAIIRFDHGVMNVLNNLGQVQEIWHPYLLPVQSDDLEQGFRTEWMRHTVISPKQVKLDDRAIPSTVGGVFQELTDRLVKTVASMGYAKELFEDRNEDEPDQFRWVFRLVQEDSDSRYGNNPNGKQWIAATPNVDMYRLWTRINMRCQVIRGMGRKDRQNRDVHYPLLMQLKELILEIVALRNRLFPGTAGIWKE